MDNPQRGSAMQITAITRLKHTALLEASKEFGGVPRMAEHLGVHRTQLYQWIAMTAVPPRGVQSNGSWPPERLSQLESDLIQLTGQTMEQLFPGEYRDAVVAGIPRIHEETQEVEHALLLKYAQKTTQRLEYQDPGELLDRSQILSACRRVLTPKESRVIDMRYDHGMALNNCAKELQVTTECVRQIESAALKKMQAAVIQH
jgi:hypothetical protein